MTQFNDLNLDPKVLKAIAEAGYETPTPIQAGAIPPALEGRDVLGIAQTGTGKTASFTLPMITLLGRGRARARMPRSLVLCPTRELAAQVAENFDTYAKHTKLTKALLIGGVSFKEQDALIDKGVDVLIATPGRLLDHFERGKLLLTGVQIMVVDEADRMLDMGFIPDIERIFGLTPFTRQTLFFSATMAPEIERITNTFLSNPEKIEVARAATTGENIKQGVVKFAPSRKDRESAEKRALLRRLIDAEGEACTNAIIFCNRKMDVDIVAKSLKKYGYNAEPIHGDLDQSQRTRTLEGFRSGDVTILVASDVAARGLDVPSVSHVFNFDVPSHAEDYVHRIGRTGRAGRKGTAVMICSPRDEKNLEDVERLVQSQIPRLDNPLGTTAADETPDEAEERPRRGRSRRVERNAPKAAERDAKAKPEQSKPEQSKAEQPKAEQPKAETVTEVQQPRPAPAPEAKAEQPRAQQRGRSGRDRRRDDADEQVVGMGEDVPAFILKSFKERRAG
ncbi:DEAD/DEAH box helicase [Limimaricola pyoseonensis]|uniref:DEAD-box ATP-dependent RNA helicase RhpA n=1 Tax=Limimaricola pyoseonensis TaxID=521013 RepID=A0A1G6ZFW2_9RHOB|nr:DEAD/DEAH box helicase [Limimaricola pyoseonensis]SDE01342.1 Superfamily II DNA and RNA helicase [Limimaricola pyoseonensis]